MQGQVSSGFKAIKQIISLCVTCVFLIHLSPHREPKLAHNITAIEEYNNTLRELIARRQ
jgi:hypothetical protein